MARVLALGAVVLVVIAAAIFVVRWARSGDHGEEEEETPMGRDRMGRPRGGNGNFGNPGSTDAGNWSPADDDYRSPHPIRGKYAAPSGGSQPGRSRGRRPDQGGHGQQPAARGGYPANDGYTQAGGYPAAAASYPPPGGYQPPPPGGYQPRQPGYGTGATAAYGTGGYGAEQASYGPPSGYRPQGGYGSPGPDADRGAARGPSGGREHDATKKKGGKRFGLRRRDDEEIWPDDGVSDEDYWATVATERSLPPANGPSANERPANGPAQAAIPAAGPRHGGMPSTGSVRFGSEDPRAQAAGPQDRPRGHYQPHPYGEDRDDPYGRGRR
jgi:hypothetical protein